MALFQRSIFCVALSVLLLRSAAAGAAISEEKNLKGRLGVGFTNQIATTADGTIPAISGKYYLSKYTAASLAVGFDTRSGASTTAIGAKLYRNLFLESNLAFYTGGGAALVSRNGSKFQFSVFLGSEFFFAQLPSLGLSFEVGLRGDKTTGSFALRTIGDSFLSAGMHFYF